MTAIVLDAVVALPRGARLVAHCDTEPEARQVAHKIGGLVRRPYNEGDGFSVYALAERGEQ